MVLPVGTQEAFEEALRSVALADDALNSAIGGRVYIDIAPSDAPTPYLIISWYRWRNENHRTLAPEIDAVANIRAVVDTDRDGDRLAVRLGDRIEAVFHRCTLTVENGWGVHWCRQTTRIRIPELVDRRSYNSAGGLYEIGAINAS